MGVIKRGILGGFAGKVANVIGSSWKGIAVMKSMPLSVANPRTSAQLAQRELMTNIVKYAKFFLAQAIKPLNDRFAAQMSGFNLFVKRNIDLFQSLTGGNMELVQFAQGVLTVVSTNNVSSPSAQRVVVEWTDNTGTGDANANDVLYITIWNQTKEEGYTDSTATRADESVTIDFTNTWDNPDVLVVLGTFRSQDGTKVSNTLSMGVLTLHS